MTPEQQIQQLTDQITKLQADLAALNSEYYANNFSAIQDFPKYSRFNTRIKMPHYGTPPATCEIGELCETGGVLKICSAANTWTSV